MFFVKKLDYQVGQVLISHFAQTNETNQNVENIKLIFEVKMSIVSNYQYFSTKNKIKYIGDYKTHKGNPSLLRSDSMLKAIGKSINIRVYDTSTKIPIVILGNSPITNSYIKKVDYLKKSGVIQGFISLFPNPSENDFITTTPEKGFQTVTNIDYLKKILAPLVKNELNYFSSMISKKELGKIITIASFENSDIAKAEKFLSLIRG